MGVGGESGGGEGGGWEEGSSWVVRCGVRWATFCVEYATEPLREWLSAALTEMMWPGTFSDLFFHGSTLPSVESVGVRCWPAWSPHHGRNCSAAGVVIIAQDAL